MGVPREQAFDKRRELDDAEADDDPELEHIRQHYVPLPGAESLIPAGSPDAVSGDRSIGVCVSGGGIRSAGFALGVLSELDWGKPVSSAAGVAPLRHEAVARDESVLGRARYLSAVSGGAWAATAWTLQRAYQRPASGTEAHRANAADEVLDWLTTHNPLPKSGFQRQNYLMNCRGGWAGSIAWVAVCIGVNTALIGSAMTALGWTLGMIQRRSCRLSGHIFGSSCWFKPSVPDAWLVAVAAVFALGALSALLWMFLPRLKRVLAFGMALLGISAVVWLFVLAVPWLFRLFHGDLNEARDALLAAIGTSAGFTMIAGLWKIAGGPLVHEVFGPLARAIPRLLGVVLAASWSAVVFLVMYQTAAGHLSHPRTLVLAGITAAVVIVCCNANWPTLHTMFSARLQRSFQPEALQSAGGDWGTWADLAARSQPACNSGVPELILCCAQQRSGIAPGGLRAESFTISPQWTRQGRRSTPTRLYLRAIDTVAHGRYRNMDRPAGWLATTGAAFSSAMGRSSLGSSNAVLAAANIDLGIWLPNLRWLQTRRGPGADIIGPTPRLLRPGFLHLIAEIMGQYRRSYRYSFITDGGHWDNLGLVELLRRGCDRIVCIDAGGDSPGTFSTLRESLALAALELGIDWYPDELDEALKPLSPTPHSPARTSVTTFTVPRPSAFANSPTDRVVVHYAKLQATVDMDLELRRYAAADPIFPRYSTLKQTLSPKQFEKLVAVGKDAGRRLKPLVLHDQCW